jgi:osmotically-inducible protein OsmY
VDEGIPDDRLDVVADGGIVTIRTTARFMADVSKIGAIAKQVAGVTEVRSALKE